MRSRKEGVRLVGRAFAGRRLGVALATAGLLGLSLTSAVVASPANANVSTWSLDNAEHVHCLTSNGILDSTAEVYSCNGSSNQTWHWGNFVGNYGQIVNGDGQCLGIAGGSRSAGATAVVWRCGGQSSQYWQIQTDPLIISEHYFANLNSQMVIQIACDCGTGHAAVDQKPFNSNLDPDQLWFFLS